MKRLAVRVPTPLHLGRATQRRQQSRDRLASVLWDAQRQRRLPRERALVQALEACDRRDPWWVCEANDVGPLYFLPTYEWVDALARWLDDLAVRRVLEVGAGDGFLSRCIAAARPRLHVTATDSGAWETVSARMTRNERDAMREVPLRGLAPGANVRRIGAVEAVHRYRPDLAIVSWAPPGPLVEQVIKADVRYVLEIGTLGDVCGNGPRTWRFAHEPLDGPMVQRALCRLDDRPRTRRSSTLTLYYGRKHEYFHEQRASPRRPRLPLRCSPPPRWG